MIGQRELVAGGAAQPDRLPDVGPDDRTGGHEHRAFDAPAIGMGQRLAIGTEHRRMRTEPGGVPATRREGPLPGDAIAALDLHRPDLRTRPPGQHRLRVLAENRARRRRVQVSRGHRAAARLAQTPGHRGVGPGDRFDHLKESERVGLQPADRPRQQQPEQPGLMQLIEQVRRQTPLGLDLIGRRLDRRPDAARTRDHRRVAGPLGQAGGHHRPREARVLVNRHRPPRCSARSHRH